MCARCIHADLRNGLARVHESRYVAVTRRLLGQFLKASMGMPTRARRDQLGPRQFRGPFCFEHIVRLRHVHFIRNLAAILCCTSLRDKSNCGQITLSLDTWPLVPEGQRRKLRPRPARVSGPSFLPSALRLNSMRFNRMKLLQCSEQIILRVAPSAPGGESSDGKEIISRLSSCYSYLATIRS
jgi:hypothetical protein